MNPIEEIQRLSQEYAGVVGDLIEKYKPRIDSIVIPDEIDIVQTRYLVAAVDRVLGDLYADFAEAKSLSEGMGVKVKAEVSRIRIAALNGIPGSAKTGSDLDRRAYAETKANDDGWYEAERICNARYNLLERLVSLIERKKELLNINRELLKIENKVTSYEQYNVGRTPQEGLIRG